MEEPTIPSESIVSTKGAAPDWSCKDENIGIAFADAAVTRYALQRGRPQFCSDTWQGFWADTSHGVVFRVMDGETVEVDWRFALLHYTDSAVIGAPIRLVLPPGYTSVKDEFIELLPDMPHPIVVTDLSKVQARRVTWRSWSFQVKEYGRALESPSWVLGVRGFLRESAENILAVAAKSGWWSLQRGILDKLVSHCGVQLAPDADLFSVLSALTMHAFGCTEEESLSYLAARLKTMKQKGKYSADLLCIDEAITCLEENDQDEVRREQNIAKDRKQEEQTFKERYRTKKASAKVTGRSGRRGASANIQWKGPSLLPRDRPIEQFS